MGHVMQPDLPGVDALAFAAIGLAPQTPFFEIAGERRFVCSACRSRRAAVSPEQREPRVAS
jgi:hypothetical protein